MPDPTDMVSVRYMVDDVDKAVAFYTKVLDFEVLNAFPAFADVARFVPLLTDVHRVLKTLQVFLRQRQR